MEENIDNDPDEDEEAVQAPEVMDDDMLGPELSRGPTVSGMSGLAVGSRASSLRRIDTLQELDARRDSTCELLFAPAGRPTTTERTGPPKFRWTRFVIDPNRSLALTTWDLIIAILLVACAFVEPFEVGLLDEDNCLFVFDHLTDFTFMVDIGLQFFVAYADPTRPGHLVRDQRMVIRHYLSTWFGLDVLSAMPIEVYYLLMDCTRRLGLLAPGTDIRLLKLTRLTRLLRLTRLMRLFMRWQSVLGFSASLTSLVKFLSVVVLCCHWMACIWGLLALQQGPDAKTWLRALQASKGGPPEMYEGPWHVYTISLYWAVVTITSIGYGDITPQTETEYWVAAFCTSMMASTWAYVIGAVCSIVSTLNPHEMAFKRRLDDINWIMVERCMPEHLASKIRRYFHETRDMGRCKMEQELIAQMSPKLQGEYAHFMHQQWIAKVWYLSNMDYEIIVWTARHMNLAVYSPYEEVLHDRTLFIVQRGLAAIKGKVLISGDVWGEDMLLSNPFLREKDKARSLSYLFVLMLSIMDLVEVVVHFPEARARLRWSQVQIALLRGVALIAKTLQELEAKGFRTTGLSEEKRMDLIADILAGKFAKSTPIPEDYLGVNPRSSMYSGGPRQTSKTLPAPPPREAPPPRASSKTRRRASSAAEGEKVQQQQSTARVTTPAADRRFEQLAEAVGELARQVDTIGTKVDTLSTASKGSGSISPRRRSRYADFGPVVRPPQRSAGQARARQTRRERPTGGGMSPTAAEAEEYDLFKIPTLTLQAS